MTVRIFIDGEAGTTGLGIRTRLRALPDITVLSIVPDQRKDTQARLALMAEADLVVLCLPDDASRAAVKMAESLGDDMPRLLDASSAFRTGADWVYGFPELTPEQPGIIATAPRVSNPGCYPTGAIAMLRPLVAAGLLPPEFPISINAVSGYTGGGNAMIAAHEASGGPAFELYGLALEHKHVPETMLHSGLATRPIFVPSVGHFPNGMLVSIPLHLDMLPGRVTAQDLRAVLTAYYENTPRVRVLDADPAKTLDAAALRDTDLLEIRVYANDAARHALLVARLDNLGKGASGAAIQNIRLMLGLGE